MEQLHIHQIKRTKGLYVIVALIFAVFAWRLFMLQVVNSGYYNDLALNEQERKFEIAPKRGTIYIQDGDTKVPLVLNEVQPTLFADPTGIKDPAKTSNAIADAIGGKPAIYEDLIVDAKDQVYVVLKKRLTNQQAVKLREADIAGVGLQDASYRVYPEGALASQVVGFSNDEGEGQYGVEAALQDDLAGTTGLLKAVTDVNGIPLTSEDSVDRPAINGDEVTLTIDRSIQQHVEQALKEGVERSEARSGSAVVVDPDTGAILAMANYPTYNPEKYQEVEDYSVFQNKVVSRAYETGSGVKVFTMAAGLQEGVINKDSSFFDAGYVQVDDRRIENADGSGGFQRSMLEVIQNSVNTGVVHVLSQLGGGSINEKARNTLYSYFTEKFGFGTATGIQQTSEAPGNLIAPDQQEGNNVRYANMAFGQGMTVTMLQMVSAFSSVVNGGTAFTPYLVAEKGGVATSPVSQSEPVVSEQVSDDIVAMTKSVITNGGGFTALREGYTIGGKTGTAQVLEEDGTYSDDREIGSFIGFTGSDRPEYVIMTRVDEPQIAGYAGSIAAAPIFADISNWLIDHYNIPPMN